MKIFLSLAVLCFALNSGLGAPAKGRYMFVRCNPAGSDANCRVHRSPELQLSPDLPHTLPASATEYIGAEPVEVEWIVRKITQPKVKTMFLLEDGSGGFEGSGMADGSGDAWIETARAQPADGELKEDHLLLL